LRVVLATLILIAVGLMSGCQRSSDAVVRSTDLAPERRSEISEPSVDALVVSFADAGLEAAIRETVGKPTGDVVDTDLAGITFLDARGRGITTLEGIQYCVDLEWLDLSDNEIIDINALSSLPHVTAVSLRDNEIVNINALSGLLNIWLLDLSNNQIVDITSIVNNEGVAHGDIVVLHENQLGRQPGSQDAADVEVLQNRGVNVLFEPSVVANFPDRGLEAAIRETIGKPSGEILDIYLIGLAFLDANNRSISNLEGIEHCVDVEKLLLRGSGIADLGLLLGLTKLRWIDLSDNEGVDINVLSRLTDLTELWLAGNEIDDVSMLSGLTNLRTLYLSNNNIRDISSLSNLTNLWLLGLEYNQIADISELAKLTNLEMLILGNNDIVDISVLAELPLLMHLYLSSNEISDIRVLSELPYLKTIALDINQIADIQALVDNEGITSMDWVDLRHNNLDLARRSPTRLNINALEDRGVYVDFYPQD